MSDYRDSERLDWMAEHGADFCYSQTMDWIEATGVMFVSTRKIAVRRPCQLMYEWHVYDGTTFRDAIDAAMAAPPCDGEEGACLNSHSIRNTMHPHPKHAKDEALRLAAGALRQFADTDPLASEALDAVCNAVRVPA